MRCYYRKYLRHHFLNNNNNEKKRKTYQPLAHALTKQVELSRKFKRMVSVNYTCQSKKRSIRNPFFYLSSNSFAGFLSQTSTYVHSSLHLTTWSPRFTSHDLYLRYRSLASRAGNVIFIFVLRRQMVINCLCFDCIMSRRKRKKGKEL